MREGESKTRLELQEIREEVNNVRDMLPKVSIILSADRDPRIDTACLIDD